MSYAVVIAVLSVFALQNPAPPAPKVGQKPQQDTAPQSENTDGGTLAPGQSVTVTVNNNQPSTKRSEDTPDHKTKGENNRPSDYRWVFDGLLALFTGALVLVTVGLLIVAWLHRQTYEATLAARKVIERAYVSMSHFPPGLQFIQTTQDIRATIKLTNSGHTPADVIGYDFTLVHVPLVSSPTRRQVPTNEPLLSIMPNDSISVWANVPSMIEVMHQIQNGSVPAFLIGWVVYRDRFGKRHRSGYGRRFVIPPPGITPADWTNLVFVDVPGYNYEEDLN
jgi:hypothetical protein